MLVVFLVEGLNAARQPLRLRLHGSKAWLASSPPRQNPDPFLGWLPPTSNKAAFHQVVISHECSGEARMCVLGIFMMIGYQKAGGVGLGFGLSFFGLRRQEQAVPCGACDYVT